MAKPKKLDTENILSFLNADTHTASDNGDPITKTRIIVTLDQLQPYALNPRKTRNPKYHDILESIESVGLKQPPIITRRHPDDEKYSIRDGGNTRLAVLTELHAKYVKLAEESIQKADKQVLLEKSERFYRFECDFVPFIHDLDALSAHMIENEARGETIFIEKALAVQQFRALFEEEDRKTALESGEDYNEKPLSSRKLANRITAQGWSVDHSHIVRFNYATDVLIQYIPDALWTGAGFHVMRKLSALNKAYTTFWLATPPGQADSSVIEPLFYDTLAEFDSETLSIDAFTEELDVLLSNRLKEHDFDVASISIHAEIQAIISDTKKSLTYLPGALNQVTSPDDLISDKSGYAPSSINPQSKRPAAKKELDQPDSGDKTGNPQVLSTENKPALPPNIVSEHLLPNNIEDLRLAIVEQAALLAELAGGPVGLTIMKDDSPLHHSRLKSHIFYSVMDFVTSPDNKPLNLGDRKILRRAVIWWQLVKCSMEFSQKDVCFSESMFEAFKPFMFQLQAANERNHYTEVILYLEYQLLLHPDIIPHCQRMQDLQAQKLKLTLITQSTQ